VADFVSVSNMALDRVGEPYRITDQAEDTAPARACRSEWDNARRAVLRRGKFNFSMRRWPLTAQAPTDPNFQTPAPWAYRFPLPTECLRVVEIYDAGGCLVSQYNNEDRAILANCAGPLTVRGVRDVPEIGNWDDLTVQALAARLGFAIADTITGDLSRKNSCWNEFRQLTSDSGGVDAKEDPPESPYDSSWVTARFGGGYGGPPNVWRG
jgi:hypothetical protein